MGQANERQTSDNVSSVSKKLVNEPNCCVNDALRGFVLANRELKLLQGWNVIVRADVEKLKQQNKVILITGGGSGHEPFAIGYVGYGGLTASIVGDVFASPTSSAIKDTILHCAGNEGVLLIVTNYTGGGSGHEPAHAGYVGDGMLTAAVCGDIFTSPSSTSIVDTIKTCASSQGVLLIVKNYTGDRLNFGKAAELTRADGINIDMVVIGEDCALTSKDKSAGRRGLCGTIFIHKMAGAMAEEGLSLKYIADFLRTAASEMGTISISLSPCSKPGQPPGFNIGHNVVEFGLGIHGEAGVEQTKEKGNSQDVDVKNHQFSSAHELVKKMIDHVWNSGYLPPLEGKDIALIVNNLGGTTNLELSIVAKEAISYLDGLKVNVQRCYVGTFVTSLEMAGVSLTIMIVNEDRLKYLDAHTSAPAWPRNGFLNDMDKTILPCISSDLKEKKTVYEKPEGIGIPVYHCLKKACTALIDNESKLNDLDAASGDGDCGSTLARGAKGLFLKLSDGSIQLPVNNPHELYLTVAKELESSMGGSSGALLSLLFTASANAFKDGSDVKDFINAFKIGIEAVKKYGGAEEGDRTMLDGLCPCLLSMESSLQSDLTVKEMLKQAAKICDVLQEKVTSQDVDVKNQASRSGADSTLNMHAHAGRASYVSDNRLTQPDPGAVAVALVFEAIEKAYTKVDQKR